VEAEQSEIDHLNTMQPILDKCKFHKEQLKAKLLEINKIEAANNA